MQYIKCTSSKRKKKDKPKQPGNAQVANRLQGLQNNILICCIVNLVNIWSTVPTFTQVEKVVQFTTEHVVPYRPLCSYRKLYSLPLNMLYRTDLYAAKESCTVYHWTCCTVPTITQLEKVVQFTTEHVVPYRPLRN